MVWNPCFLAGRKVTLLVHSVSVPTLPRSLNLSRLFLHCIRRLTVPVPNPQIRRFLNVLKLPRLQPEALPLFILKYSAPILSEIIGPSITNSLYSFPVPAVRMKQQLSCFQEENVHHSFQTILMLEKAERKHDNTILKG